LRCTPTTISNWRQLFVDDTLLEYSSGVSLRINPPLKTGRVLRSDRPWEGHRIGAYGTVLEDQNLYKMYYDAVDRDGRIFHCYAISEDGIHWKKPNLGLVEYFGSRNNNILPLPPCGTVFLDYTASSTQRYKYVTYGHGRSGHMNQYGIRVWWSEDGLGWRAGEDYALPLNADTQNQAFWDERTGKYVAYLRAWDSWPYTPGVSRRCVARAEVEDILKPWPYDPRKDVSYSIDNAPKWPPPTTELPIVFKYDDSDPENSDHYNPCVVKYPYCRDVYYMFPSTYLHFPDPPIGKRSNDGLLDIQIATSRDGVHWNRLTRDTYVRLGRKDENDSGQMYMLVGMIRVGSELWMYYAGYDYTHGAHDPETMHYTGAIFRVTQRLDGFTSIDAGLRDGEIMTKPIVFSGGKLTLNVDASASGEVRAELQDEDGKPIRGFELGCCDPIHANDCEEVVTWDRKYDISHISGKPVKLRFFMRNTKLYAFQFK